MKESSSWLPKLLEQPFWGCDELLCVLSDEDPALTGSSPENWSRLRLEIGKSVERAIQAGELDVQFTKAATSEHPFGDFLVRRGDAIRWIFQNLKRFPTAVLTADDARQVPADADNLPKRLKHVLQVIQQQAGRSQKEITGVLMEAFDVDERTAEAWVALCRSDEAIRRDRRASRRQE